MIVRKSCFFLFFCFLYILEQTQECHSSTFKWLTKYGMKKTCGYYDLYKQDFERGTVCRSGQRLKPLFSTYNDFFFRVCLFRVFPGSHPSHNHVVPEDKQTQRDPLQKLQVFIRFILRVLSGLLHPSCLTRIHCATQCQSDPVIFQAFCLNQSASTEGSSNDDDNENHDR